MGEYIVRESNEPRAVQLSLLKDSNYSQSTIGKENEWYIANKLYSFQMHFDIEPLGINRSSHFQFHIFIFFIIIIRYKQTFLIAKSIELISWKVISWIQVRNFA